MIIETKDNELLGFFGLSSVEKVLKMMKELAKYEPNYKPYLNNKVVKNIYTAYENLINKNYPLINADKYSINDIDFIKSTWTTINKLSEITNLPKGLIYYYSHAVYYLSRIGQIPLSVINPKLKKDNAFLKELTKYGKGAKWMFPLLMVTVGIVAYSQLNNKTRFINAS